MTKKVIIIIMTRKNDYLYNADYTEEIRKEYGENYRGYKLIGRDMDVRGGIFHTKRSGTEAIVVDSEDHPDVYWDYFREACDRARNGEHGDVVLGKVVGAAFGTVRSKMRYSPQGVAQIRRRFGPAEGQKIDLSAFMEAGVGVCRHQALTCAVLLEDFKEAGYIRGEISVDRNRRWNPTSVKDISGHVWVRYTTPHGTPYILDPAQNYFGTLEDSTEVAKWNYYRPEEELERYVMIQRKLGDTGVRGFFGRVRWFVKGND